MRLLLIAALAFLVVGCGEQASEEPLEPEHESPEVNEEPVVEEPEYEVTEEYLYEEQGAPTLAEVSVLFEDEDPEELAEHVAEEYDSYDTVMLWLHESGESVVAEWALATAQIAHTEDGAGAGGMEPGELSYSEAAFDEENLEGQTREEALGLAQLACQLNEAQEGMTEEEREEYGSEVFDEVQERGDVDTVQEVLEERGHEGCTEFVLETLEEHGPETR